MLKAKHDITGAMLFEELKGVDAIEKKVFIVKDEQVKKVYSINHLDFNLFIETQTGQRFCVKSEWFIDEF